VSRYGRLWDDASTYWRQIQALLPKDVVLKTPADARLRARDVASALIARVDGLAADWEAIQAKMDEEPE